MPVCGVPVTRRGALAVADDKYSRRRFKLVRVASAGEAWRRFKCCINSLLFDCYTHFRKYHVKPPFGLLCDAIVPLSLNRLKTDPSG